MSLLLHLRRLAHRERGEASDSDDASSLSDSGDEAGGADKAGKAPLDTVKAPVDIITAQRCSYNPVPWSCQQKRSRPNTVNVLSARQQGFRASTGSCASMGSPYLPNRACRPLGLHLEKMFCGRFSSSGDVYMSACQDAIIRLYDTRSVYQWSCQPHEDADGDCRTALLQHLGRGQGRRMMINRLAGTAGASSSAFGGVNDYSGSWAGAPRPVKTIQCRDVTWSVISTDFSPDDKWLAYSSWSPYVHLCNTRGSYEHHEDLDFEPTRGHFCLFSIQFSPSNTHILGGASDHCVYLYNLERKERVARIQAHGDDVNAAAYADQSSQVALSAGDDNVIKVWDLRDHRSPVGCLSGHQCGVTCITPKGDGHHFISNSKDQTLKLWDIRAKLSPTDKAIRVATKQPQWDYRWDRPQGPRLPRRGMKDQSVKTFRGHAVLQTLIRCYFSPEHTTGQRYVISGSRDGSVCVWDVLTGEMVRQLKWHHDLVRDVAWHPYLPLIATSSWDCSVGLWGYDSARGGVDPGGGAGGSTAADAAGAAAAASDAPSGVRARYAAAETAYALVAAAARAVTAGHGRGDSDGTGSDGGAGTDNGTDTARRRLAAARAARAAAPSDSDGDGSDGGAGVDGASGACGGDGGGDSDDSDGGGGSGGGGGGGGISGGGGSSGDGGGASGGGGSSSGGGGGCCN